MKTRLILPALAAVFILSSCAAPKVAYFQDREPGVAEQIAAPKEIKIRPKDKLSILVNSKDPMLTDLFNLPIVSRQVGTSSESVYARGLSGYTVDKNGEIDFPVLGKIYVEGKSREEIASFIKEELISNNLVKDPVVTVEFMNLSISVLGEVNKPGRYSIDRDQLTILDALSMAGDLTIYGKRDNVLVQREENGKLVNYQVNLGSWEELSASPVYYMQQNDVVYVEPNSVKARQATVNGNNIRSTSFWISLASLLTSIGILVFN